MATTTMTTTPVADSRWVSHRYHLSGEISLSDEVTLHLIDCLPLAGEAPKGIILLIHGFPQTSHQFRHVITPLANAGYRVLAPDTRGAGHSSHPRDGFTKTQMARDLHQLVREHLGIKSKVHVVGHDIGGMIAHAYASRYPNDTASVTWGECPLPGTQPYEDAKHTPPMWHFTFHQQPDLPELLVQGRERVYIKHFYDRLCQNPAAISPADVEHYAMMFSQPGAMRCGFDGYRAFEQDALENREWLKKEGKCKVPTMALSGERSVLASIAKAQTEEMYENSEVATVDGTGHWCAEENPGDFVRKILAFVGKHSA